MGRRLNLLIILIIFLGGCMTALGYDPTYKPITPQEQYQASQDIPILVEEIKRKQRAPTRIEKIKSKNWSSRITDKVINRKVILGMTKEQVIASWGRPNDINRSVGSWGVHEQWVYDNKYLYFEDGVLTSFQD